MTTAQISDIQSRLNNLAESLDAQWLHNQVCQSETSEAEYSGMLRSIRILGIEWSRDNNGQHKLHYMGLTGATE